ncbi:O-methyltransferase domain protein [Solidesulfovibrio fructosivorans JJ]]|uniref:O-methyltransferase domain protein n=1 Tax=Solidesulfovibrio fructosivorans JJ] TaxID=596151 RepID=E1JS26_SOLFR|nr:class I SAM-dependent methyltransferase [Solidesulfovibrio fructosivorans]EFL52795.1 O-methyltransferase domain protein [Solidesulfovibrio fructosivorans JJ]]
MESRVAEAPHLDHGNGREEPLRGIPETMLIPLWAKAMETLSARPIVRDPKAVEMLARIDYDFSRFNKARLTQVGVAVRTMLLDDFVRDFLHRNENVVVINLGAGLDTRYHRLALRNVCWYDLDLPEAIAWRRRFFPENETCRCIAKSVFDLSWMDAVEARGPFLLIAEGLFMYFPEERLRPLFRAMVNRFAGAEMLLEILPPFLVGKSNKHESVKMTASVPEFLWSVKNAKDLTAWHPCLQLVTEWNYFDFYKERWKWFGCLARLPGLRGYFASRIAHLHFGNHEKDYPG